MATIRMMTAADYPAVAAMADDAIRRGLVGRPGWETAEDVAAEVTTPGRSAFIVAEDGEGQVVGLAGYRLSPAGEADLYGPLVSAEGHGIGAWLASRIELMADHQGATSYAMLIGLTNRSGAAWAEWRGYLRDSEQPEMLLTWLYPGRLLAAPPAGEGCVRLAAPADLDRVHELAQECFPADGLTRNDWAGRLGECWVVEQAGKVHGFHHLHAATGQINHLCVDPALRRRGLAARLLTEAIPRFWERRPVKVGIAVDLEDTAPVSLFRRLGFRREVTVAKWMKR